MKHREMESNKWPVGAFLLVFEAARIINARRRKMMECHLAVPEWQLAVNQCSWRSKFINIPISLECRLPG